MAKPTEKSEAIEQLLGNRRELIQINVCTWCGRDAETFRDALSRKEYTISGLCQSCQDETFGVDNDE